MNYTQHYQLPQWVETDRIMMDDFNDLTQKIDSGLSGLAGSKAELVTGTYHGDSAASRTISLGFTPKAVLVVAATGHMSSPHVNYRFGGLALPDHPVTTSWGDSSGDMVLNITTGGFQVYFDYDKDIFSNYSDYLYHYIALR